MAVNKRRTRFYGFNFRRGDAEKRLIGMWIHYFPVNCQVGYIRSLFGEDKLVRKKFFVEKWTVVLLDDLEISEI